SDRVRIEIRDKDSGMVVGVKNLRAVLDYDIDYLQGRIMLSESLSGNVSNDMLISNGGSSGDQGNLVVRYEYTPGFDKFDGIVNGGRMHAWFADMVKVGITGTATIDDDSEGLAGIDITLRKTVDTWLKVQTASSVGQGPETLLSNDGGFDFTTVTQPIGGSLDAKADANRIDISLALDELFDETKGKFTAYTQELEAGYAAPGIVALSNTKHAGGALSMPVIDGVQLKLKLDKKAQDQGLKTSANEINVDYVVDDFWKASFGYRQDERVDESPAVPLTQKEGKRNDIILKAEYDSKEKWSSYLFTQNTVSKNGNREENSRTGVGGAYRTSDQFKLNGEISAGDLGAAAKLGTEYLYNDRNTLYANYSLDNERSDNGLSSRRGNMVTGVRSQYSDSASVYVEEKYTHGDVPTGLTNTLGVDLTPNDKWNFGARIDVGSLQDNNTGAITSRNAYGVDVGYGFESIKLASALEFRVDETENPDATTSERTTWLTKTSLKYQFSPSWRFITKLNHSESESTQGEFYSGNFTEAVLGYGYRPVMNDRLNALVKYTYFYNLPTADQVTIENTAVDFIQKSNIMSLDMTYDLTRDWSLGGKYGYRAGEIAYDRVAPVFFKNNAHLYVLRADWHLVNKWD
ncbi:MAG: flagellar motor protein MotB, partial [Gammaproteobacteria bacterium]|nr:flagellar motor protein MotB [Gammaproteobacteria bacterium]